MGNEQGKEDQDEQNSDFLGKYETVKKITDSKFGECTILQDKATNQQCLLREFNSTDEEEYKKGIEKYKGRLKFDNPNIVKLVGFHYKQESQFCSTFYKSYLVIEYLNNSLEKEINLRRQQNQWFTEEELWSLLTGSVLGLAYFQQNNINHQNIKPSTIYIDSEGIVKIADPLLFNQMSNFATLLTNQSATLKSVYLSPVLVQALAESNWSPVHDQYKSDVFSLGMVLLHSTLMENLDNCYKYEDSIFFREQLEKKIAQIQQNKFFSPNYLNTIKMMLTFSEQQRPDFLGLWEYLHQMQLLQTESSNIDQSQAQVQQSQKLNSGHKDNLFMDNQQIQNSSYKTSNIEDTNEVVKRHGHHVQSNQSSQPKPSERQLEKSIQKPELVFRPMNPMRRNNEDIGSLLKCIPSDRSTDPPIFDENTTNEPDRPSVREDYFQDGQQHNQNFQSMNDYQNLKQQQMHQQELLRQQQEKQYLLQMQQQRQLEYQEQQRRRKQEEEYQQRKQQEEREYYKEQLRKQQEQQRLDEQRQEQQRLEKSRQEQLRNEQQYSKRSNDSYQKQQPDRVAYKKEEPAYQSSYQSKYQPSVDYQQSKPESYKQVTGTDIEAILRKYTQKDANKGQVREQRNIVKEDSPKNLQYSSKQFNYSVNTSEQTVDKSEDNNLNPYCKSYRKYVAKEQNSQLDNSPQGNEEFLKDYKIDYQNKDSQFHSKNSQYQTKDSQNKTKDSPYQNQSNYQTSQKFSQQPEELSEVVKRHEVSHDTHEKNFNHHIFQQEQDSPQDEYQEKHEDQDDNQINEQFQQFYNNEEQLETEQVIENYQNGSRYEGEKFQGMRHGRGRFYYQDGGLYDGEWKENKMHGKGVLYYASGTPAYDGDWVEDKFQGFGQLFNENPAEFDEPFDFTDFDMVEELWVKYDGEFQDDNKEGYGTLYLSNGEKFSGTFQKDFVNGPGTFYKLDGKYVSGLWLNNKLN